MSDSDSDYENETWVPYSKRPEWADVKPIPEHPSVDVPPVCHIAYSERFRETMDYFRAVLCADEFSERALKLSEEAILCNQSNYTAWHYRRECLVALKAPASRWADELKLVQTITEINPKNYQLWYHRQSVVRRTGDVKTELDFCRECVKADSKNYHAWAHRQWVLDQFADDAMWEAERVYVEELLTEDVRNNSAWNQRFFIIKKKTLRDGATKIPNDVALNEILFAIPLIHKSPNNECPWNYMRGVATMSESGDLLAFPKLKEVAVDYCARCPACPHCRSLLADIADAEGDDAKRIECLVALRDNVDTMRRKYWQYLIDHPANPALVSLHSS